VLKHYFLALVATAATHFVLAIFVYLKGPRKLTNVTYASYSLAIAWWSSLEAFAITSSSAAAALFLWRFNHVGVIFIPIFFVHFVVSLLNEPERRRKRRVVLLSYLMGACFLALDATGLLIPGVVPKFSFHHFINPGPAYLVFFCVWVGWAVYGLTLLFKIYAKSRGVRRNQLRYFCWSMLVAYIGGAPNFLPTFNIEIPVLMPFGTYAIPAYAFMTTYAVVRYRLMDINLIFTRTAVFMAVYVLALGGPLLVALPLQPRLEQILGPRWWVWLLIAYAALATAAHYANLYFQRQADNRLLAEQRRYQTVLRQAAQGMTLIKEMDRLLNLVVHILTRTVRISHAAVYLLDKEPRVYVLRAVRGTHDLEVGQTIRADSPLIHELTRQRGAVVQEELKLQLQGGGGSESLRAAEQMMGTIKASVIVPSLVEERLIGFLMLGEKRSTQAYSQDDLQVFEVLASQAALAIENAQFYEELQRTQADLFQTAKMATLGQMAGGMSHQINNRFYVLTILAGTMKAAMKDVDLATADPATRQALWTKALEVFHKIEDNSIRGGDIVKTLLKFSRPSKDAQPITIAQVVATALEMLKYRVNLEAVQLTQQFSEDLPTLRGNLNQLADSCFNLLSNAYDATQKKEELLKAQHLTPGPRDPTPYQGRLTLTARVEQLNHQRWVVLEVEDNGVGMSPQEQTQLFIPFFTTKATAEKGTGLGLFIIKRIIEQHGGTITAASTYGVGTTFTMRLPVTE